MEGDHLGPIYIIYVRYFCKSKDAFRRNFTKNDPQIPKPGSAFKEKLPRKRQLQQVEMTAVDEI